MTTLVMLSMAYTGKHHLSIHATDAIVDRPVRALLKGLRSFRCIRLADHKQARSSLICIKVGPPAPLRFEPRLDRGQTLPCASQPWAAYFARELAVVIPEVVIPKSEYDYKRETTSACILQNVVAEARLNGVQVKSLHRCHRDPYRAIIDTAEHEGCDLIVMGSDCNTDLVGTLLGSETTKVMTQSSIPVLIYRHRPAI